MKIDREDLYYGAAILQVADHKSFKAINPLPASGLSHTYRINTDVGLHLKYARKPIDSGAYQFNFTAGHLEALDDLWPKKVRKLVIGLVCARAREIACVRYVDLTDIHNKQQAKQRRPHSTLTVMVTPSPGKQLRVWAPWPNRRGWPPLVKHLIPRSDFPRRIFHGA